MKNILEALSNAQGWAEEACRLLKKSGARKEATAVQKALRLLNQTEKELLCFLIQREEMIKLLTPKK